MSLATPTVAPTAAPPVTAMLRRRIAVAAIGVAVLVLLALTSLFVGSGGISPADVWRVLQADDGSTTALLVREPIPSPTRNP